MTQKFQKLKTLLQELFQLDQPDLDFGLYRVMHARSAEVSQFLDQDLLPQVQTAFGQYQTADKAGIEQELAKVIAGIEAAGMDPLQSPKVADLRSRLAHDAVDIGALESEVYDHLFSFFRRYYSEGDFLAKRVYKPGVYAIPYEGEEVTLHWANKDQYYIKTSEYLRDYAFRLRPDDDKKPLRVHFRLTDAAEGEHGNVKEAAGKERRFKLAAECPLAVEDGELIVRFTYQPDPAKQKELNAAAEAALLATSDPALTEWLRELRAPHHRADGSEAGTRLRVHLDRYTARNTFDYFIHKDLGTFLRRELDFYIKNEVMHLDDVENESAPRVEQYLSKIKVIRKIAGKIIAFLAQLEGFQKKLWLKKKFVVETSWCITIGCIPEEFHAEIAANAAQHEEWIKLFAIDEIDVQGSTNAAGSRKPGAARGDLFTEQMPLYSKPLKPNFLKAHPTLVVDTRHFDADFTARLLEAIGDVDEKVDGVLFHSENFQALSGMQARYRERLTCICIDPPYNTGGDGFAYKDSYQHSSWAAMLSQRVELSTRLLYRPGAFWMTLDDNELYRGKLVCDDIFGGENFVATVAWQKKVSPSNDSQWFSADHDYLLVFSTDKANWSVPRFARSDDQTSYYSNPDNDPRGDWNSVSYTCNKTAEERPNLFYAIRNPTTGEDIWPKREAVWRFSPERHLQNEGQSLLYWGANGLSRSPRVKKYLVDAVGIVPRSVWPYSEAGHTQEATTELNQILPSNGFRNPKPVRLFSRVASPGRGGHHDDA